MRLTLALVVMTFLSLEGFAQTRSYKKRRKLRRKAAQTKLQSKKKVQKAEPKLYELTASFDSDSWIDFEDDKLSGSGVSLQLRRNFLISDFFETSTGLEGRLISHDEDDADVENGSVSSYQAGINQRFSLVLGSSAVKFKPFIQGGVVRGRYDYEDKYTVDSSTVNYEAKADFWRFGGTAGIQMELENGITPFVAYNISRINVDKDLDSKLTVDGENVEIDPEDQTLEKKARKVDARSIVVGLGYTF
jgi:opacity protein-like surface antigen